VSFATFLNNWWNFPYLVMIALVAVYFVLQIFGMAGHGDADHDVDADADADADADGDADHDADHEGGGSGHASLASFFGVGRVPFMVIWVSLFLFAGFAGLFVNRVYVAQTGGYAWWFFLVSLVFAFVVGLVGVKLFAGLAAKLVDTGGKGSSSKKELVGKIGVVASARLDETTGEVRVHDSAGTEMLVHARLQKGEAPLARGAKVVLVEYDATTELFWATASPAEAEAHA
jgi:hypothetical protein